MFTKITPTILLILWSLQFTFSQNIVNDNYIVAAGPGKGIKFWTSNNYKIHMGKTAEYRYGPVNDYSIKMNMSDHANRGWTWGVVGKTPIMALNTIGNLQLDGDLKTIGNLEAKGSLKSTTSRKLYLGEQFIYSNNNQVFYFNSNNSSTTQIILRDKESTNYGRLIGTGDGVNFGLMDGDGHWSILNAKDNYTAFRINNSEKMRIKSNGYIGIGTINPGYSLHVYGSSKITNKVLIGNVTDDGNQNYKLFVEKGILAEKVRVAVRNTSDWADFVFDDDYTLMPLNEVELFISKNKHLPGVPTSDEVVKNGIDLAKTDAVLLQKLEESYLYIIQLQNEVLNLKTEMTEIKEKLK